MKKIVTATIIALLATTVATATTATAAAPPASEEPMQIRRYLLSAGANNGGRDRVLLRYAVSDARAFAAVLTDMGGVDKNNALILENPNTRELLSGITTIGKLAARDKAPDVRHEVFIYYSGHADVDGLKLGSETLKWEDFRNAVNGLDAEVRVAVLDACGSGAITRTKGGVQRPAFLSDASANMKGYAFLTSSNENEASQESDRIKGSYFTHALLSGMRGAADMTGDGKVTINEAYQYAFNETLRNTQNTSAGAQHPSRDMNLAGTGDIVMTDLRETSAILSLNADIEGRFFIRNAGGALFAELNKLRGRKIELGMPPGKYAVQMEAPTRAWMAGDIVIADGRKTALSINDMKVMKRKLTVARGGGDAFGDWNGGAGDALYSLNVNILGLSLAAGEGSGVSYHPAAKGLGLYQAGVFNVTDEVERFQAGAVNFANGVGQVQAGAVNTARYAGSVQAGALNLAMDVGTAQIGAVNAAGGSKHQIGVVNTAMESHGRQIGVINIARYSEKTPVGVLSVALNGIYDMTVYADAAGDFTSSLRVGMPWLYNLIEYSSAAHNQYTRYKDDGLSRVRPVGYGAGTRFGMNGKFKMNLDFVGQRIGNRYKYEVPVEKKVPQSEEERILDEIRSTPGVLPPPGDLDDPNFAGGGKMATNMVLNSHDGKYYNIYYDNSPPNSITGVGERAQLFEVVSVNINYDKFQDYFKLRFGASYSPLPYFAITGGLSLNAMLDSYNETINHKPATGYYKEREFKDFKMRYWPGVYVGLTTGKVGANFR